MSPVVLGGLIGALGGIGLAMVVRYAPVAQRPSLAQRVLPYINDVAKPSSLLAQMQVRNPFSVLEKLIAPWVSSATGALERLSGSPALTSRRLEASGANATIEQFRAQQLVFGVLGLAGGLFLALLAALRGHTSLVILLAMVGLGGITGIALRDWLLTQRVKRRRSLILLEFPTVADLLALAVGAGEGPVAAMERVAAATHGELAHEFGRAIGDVRAGAAVPTALSQMAGRVDLLPFTRFVDGLVVSLDRGTPLAAVLRAQAGDVREAARRELMEEGGRKEIAMMVPVVFLVLPVTVLFAIYPGMTVLSLGM